MKKKRFSAAVCAAILAAVLCLDGCSSPGGPDPVRHLEAARAKLEAAEGMETELSVEVEMSALGSSLELTASADTVLLPDARKLETRATLSTAIHEYNAHYAMEEADGVHVYTFHAQDGWSREVWDFAEYEARYPTPDPSAVMTLCDGRSGALAAEKTELKNKPAIRISGTLPATAVQEILLTYGLVDALTSALDADMAQAVAESVAEQDKTVPGAIYLDPEDDTLLRAELDLSPLMRNIVNKVLSYMGDPALAAVVKVGDSTVTVDFQNIGSPREFTLPAAALEP